ncbi:hypothetical protein BYI23_B004670 [Burkholderia sp. YI23]|nr:hypothetical protein BYI23_B004670 [Burkholderia sp. YI23]
MPGAAPQAVDPQDYQILFESPAGALVLEDLAQRFCGRVYVPGGQEGERETCFRSGRREVVEFILRQINRANGAEPTTEEE